MKTSALPRLVGIALALSATPPANAYSLYADDDTHLNTDLQAVFAAMHSQQNYAQSGRLGEGSSNWQEGYIKYGLSGDTRLGNHGTAYGAFALLSSGTFGDGDAAGFTDGSERTTKIEDAYAGWRSGSLLSGTLGEDGIDLSFGRQNVVVGDGFIINGDALNLGNGLADGEYNRGGAYYLAARKSFDKTAVLRLGGKQGWRSDLMYLKSDNRAQASPELFVGTLEHVANAGTVGLTYVNIRDIDQQYASPLQQERDGLKTYSLRATGNAGIPDLALSGEYAWQDKRTAGDQDAWYLEAGWTFSQVPWSPSVTYRYSRFSAGYDPLFYGLSRGFGTWFQGEVAGNYAGPFNTNTRIQHLAFKAKPLDNLNLGALLFDFDTVDRSLGNLDGRELDLYAEWTVNAHLTVVPLVGLYQPNKSADNAGTQLGNNDRNVYTQLIFATQF
ncbi:alginate export family protein [Pseudomonas abieticivorans]|uniref:alginate export family protein n=1 Tax=Pseudomonas abieticivorans TaxID=2931382 RepID=UPI0020BDEE10|nr:alginate export family protein [Pseudomonas sp. PIA16]